MNKGHLDYRGLKKDPFYLAPDNEMMYLGGQYYETAAQGASMSPHRKVRAGAAFL